MSVSFFQHIINGVLPRGKKCSIIVLGMGRSGTTYLWTMIKNCFKDPILIFEGSSIRQGAGPVVEKMLIEQFLIDPQKGDTFQLKSSLKLISILRGIYLCYPKRIFVYRDPRDNLISRFFWYHSYKNFKDIPQEMDKSLTRIKAKEGKPNSINFKDMILALPGRLRGRILNQHIFLHSEFIPKYISKNKWMFLKYEDLVDGCLTEFSCYLGLDLDLTVELAREHQAVKRTQSYGFWRDWFTDEDVVFFRPLFSRYMKIMGYDACDWEINRPKKIHPGQGSEYVKLFYNRHR